MARRREKFIGGCVEHGTPKKKAQELFDLIEPFARYGFNKSHAVAYALVAYKTAYLKAHYPVDFFGANLSAEIGSTDGIVKVLGDCQESGIAVLPPDINESARASPPSATRSGSAWPRSRASARPPRRRSSRSAARGRSRRSRILAMRLDSHLVNKRTLDALIAAGAFDSLGRNRATLAAASERVVARAARTPRGRGAGPVETCSAAAPPRSAARRPTTSRSMPDWALDERLKGEKETLGFYVTGHPLTRFSRGDRALRRGARRRAGGARRPVGARRRRARPA